MRPAIRVRRLKTRRARWRLRHCSASLVGLALGLLAVEVAAVAGAVDALLADGDPVQRAVELAVAAAVEPVAIVGGRRRRRTGRRRRLASWASLAKRSVPAVSPTSLAAVSAPQPGTRAAAAPARRTSASISRSSSRELAGQLAAAGGSVRGQIRPARRLLAARQAPAEPLEPHLARPAPRAGQLELGPSSSCRCQRRPVLDPRRSSDQVLAMIDAAAGSHSARSVKVRRRQRSAPSRSAARATARASIASDLPARARAARARPSASARTRTTRSPRRDQEALQPPGDVAAVLDRPQRARPPSSRPHAKQLA